LGRFDKGTGVKSKPKSMPVMIHPLVHELLRRRKMKKNTKLPQRTSYLWSPIVRHEEVDMTPVIEG
tara:strand:- start:192 stop:389 length:198 start_codon:yes stop_codon:yes gene_type:complete